MTSDTLTLDELIDQLHVLRDAHGGNVPIAIFLYDGTARLVELPAQRAVIVPNQSTVVGLVQPNKAGIYVDEHPDAGKASNGLKHAVRKALIQLGVNAVLEGADIDWGDLMPMLGFTLGKDLDEYVDCTHEVSKILNELRGKR